LNHLDESEREEQAHHIAVEEARTPYDLSKGPLVRATLLKLDEHHHILLFIMHHIISDGWSIGVLVQDVAAFYESFRRGQPAALLPELPIQYADFAVWQRQWLQGEVLESQIKYWEKQLGGDLPVLRLPTDRPRGFVETHRGAKQTLHLPKDLSDSLKTLAGREEATLFMVLLAAFQILLQRYSG